MMTEREQTMFELSHNVKFPDVPEWARISEMRVPPRTRNTKRPVVAMDAMGNDVKKFDSSTQAAEWAGRGQRNGISTAIKKGTRFAGYYWRYASEST